MSRKTARKQAVPGPKFQGKGTPKILDAHFQIQLLIPNMPQNLVDYRVRMSPRNDRDSALTLTTKFQPFIGQCSPNFWIM